MHMSKRIRTTLTLDDEVVNRAKELGINLSAAAERGIIEYIKEIEAIRSKRRKYSRNNSYSDKQFTRLQSKNNKGVGLSEFESESLAPKAKRMDQATLQAQHTHGVTTYCI
jgi:post-segregation antitoxin (ccd killing protein)